MSNSKSDTQRYQPRFRERNKEKCLGKGRLYYKKIKKDY